MSKILFEKLPSDVSVGGEIYEINTDFRCMAVFENNLMNTDRRDSKKTTTIFMNALKDFYKENIPSDTNGAINAMWDFYRCGEDITKNINKFGSTSRNVRLYDYDIDAARIAAAFRSQYGIDLSTETLHWWLFKSYLTSLDSECDFVRVMSYRGMDLKEIKDAKTRNRYKKLKEYYKLPEVKITPMTLEERDAAFLARMKRR